MADGNRSGAAEYAPFDFKHENAPFDFKHENEMAEVLHGNGPKAGMMAFMRYIERTGIHVKLVKAWLRKQGPGSVDHLEFDELASEAFLATVDCLKKFKAGKGSLFRYARMPVFEKLDIFRGQSRCPATLSQRAARSLNRDLHAEGAEE
ncbi:MAG: hypothetical protein ACYTFQ_00240 [Planctomycetota bacterium]|jgi:hypothetical protein